MSNSAVKNFLNRDFKFLANKLSRKVTLILAFENPKLYQDEFPVCSYVLQFPPHEPVAAEIKFTDITAFFIPLIDDNNVVHVTTWGSCAVGQQVVVKNGPDGRPIFDPPTPGDEGYLQCINQVGTIDLGIGFVKDNRVSPCVIWTNDDHIIKVKPPLVLNVFAVERYFEHEIIRGDPQSPVWSGDISRFLSATFGVSINPETGAVEVILIKH